MSPKFQTYEMIELLIKFHAAWGRKQHCIKNRLYEKASYMRDDEKGICMEILNSYNGTDLCYSVSNWDKFQDLMMSEFNIMVYVGSSDDPDGLTTLQSIIQILLRDINIDEILKDE
jgi:hypothetical protein